MTLGSVGGIFLHVKNSYGMSNIQAKVKQVLLSGKTGTAGHLVWGTNSL